MFEKKTAWEKEWEKQERQEARFLQKRMEKKDTFLNQKLEGKVPDKLQDTLDAAFCKAFEVIFEKGTAMIEKTYSREKRKQDYQVREYAADLKEDRKSLRAFSRKAGNTGNVNLLLSGVSGVGLGVLGVGLPDIALFTATMMKGVYEIALSYGYGYDSAEERYFILLVLQGSVAYGEQAESIDRRINAFIKGKELPENYDQKEQIRETSAMFSREMLYLKFLQGIPIVGAVGGAYNAIYMKRITGYANLKYKRRFLLGRK